MRNSNLVLFVLLSFSSCCFAKKYVDYLNKLELGSPSPVVLLLRTGYIDINHFCVHINNIGCLFYASLIVSFLNKFGITEQPLMKSIELFLEQDAFHHNLYKILEIALKWTLPGQPRLWICPCFRYKPINSSPCKSLPICKDLNGDYYPVSYPKKCALLCPRLDPHISPHMKIVLNSISFFKMLWWKWGWQMPLPICQNQEEFFNHFNDALFAAKAVSDHFLYSKSLLNDVLTSLCQQNLLSNHLCFSLSQIVLTRFAARDLIFSFYQQSKIRSH